MKKIYLKLQSSLLLVVLLFSHFTIAMAQETGIDSLMVDELQKRAYSYLHGNDSVAQDYKKAYGFFYHLAKKYDNAESMNVLGVMRKEGLGVNKMDTLAARYFFAAAKRGSAQAYYNLGLLYKAGELLPQDFGRACWYFRKAYDSGYSGAAYGLAYCYYLGLGVEQSYSYALYYYVEGAKKGYANCMYGIGLCYKHGYGVEQDNEKCSYWIQHAMERGYKPAERMLLAMSSESPASLRSSIKKVYKESLLDSNVKRKTVSEESLRALEGSWNGTSFLLDWSADRVVGSYPLKLNIVSSEGRIWGEWIQNGAVVSEIEGALKDSVVVFENSYIPRKSAKDTCELQSIVFSLGKGNGMETLYGDVSLYSLSDKEPYRPNLIILNREASSSNGRNKVESFSVSPNPFQSNFEVKGDLSAYKQLSIELYSLNGLLMKTILLSIVEGQKNLLVTGIDDLPKGTYALKIKDSKTVLYSTVVIKQ